MQSNDPQTYPILCLCFWDRIDLFCGDTVGQQQYIWTIREWRWNPLQNHRVKRQSRTLVLFVCWRSPKRIPSEIWKKSYPVERNPSNRDQRKFNFLAWPRRLFKHALSAKPHNIGTVNQSRQTRLRGNVCTIPKGKSRWLLIIQHEWQQDLTHIHEIGFDWLRW